MKKQLIATLFCGSIALFFSCQKKSAITYDYPPKPERSTSDNKLKEVFATAALAPQSFKVDATTGGSFTTRNGSTYTIPPDIFVHQDNSPVTGEVEVIVKELFAASQMILNDKPTVTRDGQLLQSFGEFKVDAKQGTDVLKLKTNAVVPVAVPVRRDTLQGRKQEIPMWDGDTLANYTTSGHDFENNPVTVTQLLPFAKGIDWTANGKYAVEGPSSLSLTIDKLGVWRNCDALYSNAAAKTTVICYFTNVFDATQLSSSYQGIEPNLLFFKKKGLNTLVKLYNRILNAPEGKNGFLSYQNSFEIGMQGTFLAIVYKDSKFYAASQDVVIGAPETGKSFYGVSLILKEVTQAEMLALIATMDTK